MCLGLTSEASLPPTDGPTSVYPTGLPLSAAFRETQMESAKLLPPAEWMSGLRDDAVRGSARKARCEKKLQGDATVASEPE